MAQLNPPPDRIKGSNETTPSITSIGVARNDHRDVTDIYKTNKIKGEAASSPLVHVFLLAATMLWTPLQRCGRPPTTRKRKSIVKPGNASSVANRDTSHAFVPQRKTGRCRTTASSKQRATKSTATSPTSALTRKHWQLAQ